MFMQKPVAFFLRAEIRKKQGISGESWEQLMEKHGNIHMYDEWWKERRVNPSFSINLQYFLASNIPCIIFNLFLALVILYKHVSAYKHMLIDIF